ncbi:MAG: DUF3540 domain-containing protein [Thermodesulfobacteriota bacterium]
MKSAPWVSGQNKESIITARIKAKDESFYWLESPLGLLKARKAFACLIEPRVTDQVLAVLAPSGQAYVLTILEREGEDRSSSLVFEDNVALSLQKGELKITTPRLNLLSGFSSLFSNALEVKADRGRAVILDLDFWSRSLKARFESVSLLTRNLFSTAERVFQKMKNCYREVEDLDQTRAGRLACLIRDTLLLKGRRSTLLAEKKVKIDAEKIHLG